MAFCIKCGTQLQDGANFCAKCGTPAQAAAEPLPNGKGKVKIGDKFIWEGDLLDGNPCGKGKITNIQSGYESEAEYRGGKLYLLDDKKANTVEKTALEKEADDLSEKGMMLIGTDNDEAERVLIKAAEMGSIYAMQALGELYGPFLKNWAKAAEWYQKAIDLGDEASKRSLNELRKSGLI